jgi:hypothetical protein
VCALGSCTLTAFAQIAAAHASFLRRLSHPTTRHEVVGGRSHPLAFPHCLARDSRALLQKPVRLGARARLAARLIVVRMPDDIVHDRRQARAVAKQRGSTPAPAQLTLRAWKLFMTKILAPVWPPQTVASAYALRWQVAVVVKSWQSPLPRATPMLTTKNSPLCSLYGRRNRQ